MRAHTLLRSSKVWKYHKICRLYLGTERHALFSPVAKRPSSSSEQEFSSQVVFTSNRKSTLGTSLSSETEASVSMHRWTDCRQQHLVLAVNCQLKATESCQCYRLQCKYLAEDLIIMCSWLLLNSVTWCIMQIITWRCTVKGYYKLE